MKRLHHTLHERDLHRRLHSFDRDHAWSILNGVWHWIIKKRYSRAGMWLYYIPLCPFFISTIAIFDESYIFKCYSACHEELYVSRMSSNTVQDFQSVAITLLIVQWYCLFYMDHSLCTNCLHDFRAETCTKRLHPNINLHGQIKLAFLI